MAWIALAPLFVALQSGSLARAFGLGLATGVVYFVGTLYWISRVMAVYGGLQPVVAVLVNMLLVAFLALFPACFALIARRLSVAYGTRALIAAPAVWAATELGRTHLFGGFPWVLLGYSQVSVLPVAQLASLFGVYGVSVLVASVSSALAAVVVVRSSPDRGDSPLWAYVWAAGVVAALLAVAVWGKARVASGDLIREGEAFKVGLVQGNVDQAQKWSVARASAILDEHLELTLQAVGKGATLVIWPESSTPFMLEENVAQAERVRRIAQRSRVPILLGSDQVERGSPDKYYNSAFLIRADGGTGGVYRKMHLVPFGEYVPFRNLLFFAAPLVESIGAGFFAGDRADLLPVGDHQVSTAICYEIVYPDLVRRFVLAGSELLTTITNDAWFGATSAPYQHFAQASMRSIENGRYLVRAANTGISGIVDPYGRVLTQSRIFEPAVVVGEARFLQGTTFYTRHGDQLAYGCALFTLALLVAALVATPRGRRRAAR